MEDLTEAELEEIIRSENSDQARFVLGRLLLEGCSDKVAVNEKKGINWLKEASKNNYIEAIEYKAYYEIRFDKQPKLKKIQGALEKVIDQTRSTKSCNCLAEFYHA